MIISKILRIATRKSKLAICQSNYVCRALKTYYPNIQTKLIPILTTGDRLLEFSLCDDKKKIKKGVFIKELEYALVEHRADIAVHSMKDITAPLPRGLSIPVLCERDDPRDAFVSLKYSNIDSLPGGSIIGTSSLRRTCQIKEYRSDLIISDLRGNIDTRLKKLHYGQYDAIILATAGLNRLQLNKYIRSYIDPSDLLPAMGQGAIAIECRADDTDTISLVSVLSHEETFLCVQAERIITTYLESYCRYPVASYAKIIDGGTRIWLRALIGLPDGSKIIRVEGRESVDCIQKLAIFLAKELLVRFKNIFLDEKLRF